MENLNYSISIKEVDFILFPHFQKILPDIPSHSFCFNYCLYPDEFQISISRPNFSLEPQILYPTVYLTFPLECPNSTCLKLNSLHWLPTSTPPRPSVFLISQEWEVQVFTSESWVSSLTPLFPQPFTFSQSLFCQLNLLKISQAHPIPSNPTILY